MERRKYLGYPWKDYFKTFTSKVIKVEEDDIKGYAAFIQIEEVSRPFMVGDICLADNGYSALSFEPEGENWGVEAIYDDCNNIVEWYFDITKINSVDENGEPYIDDLYLDAALMPDGQILILDEDELKDALDSGSINQYEFDMAHRVLKELIEKKIIEISYMETLCSKLKTLLNLAI